MNASICLILALKKETLLSLKKALLQDFNIKLNRIYPLGSGNNGEAYIAAFDLVSGFMGNGYLPEKGQTTKKRENSYM